MFALVGLCSNHTMHAGVAVIEAYALAYCL